ncbi:MAG: hypothetical protein JO014_22735 [Metakosakonia sp.]|nr:hypothetical protein [Phytobacter sp.]MBV8875530.1 hypothetical protein [Phytobacter sp.]
MSDSDKENRGEDRYRLRLSLRPELEEALTQAATALKINRNDIAVMCLSIGLRFLDVSILNPGGGGISQAVEQRLTDTASAIAGDVALPMQS